MTEISNSQYIDREGHVKVFLEQIKKKSDKITNQYLIALFLFGLFLASFYGTWLIAIGVGGISLLAYYSAKFALPESNLYQYVLSAVLGIFMAQYIYEMHGLFEMHFLAFIGAAMLITYQNWRLQIPLAIVVVVHHALFGYLQYIGFSKIYFTKLEYMDLQTFIFHISLAAIIFFICGLWAYHFKRYSESNIEQTYEMARLQGAEKQKEELLKANMELDKFVYCVSHDLRAPLTSMLGVVDISENLSTDPLVQKHMELLKRSIKKMDGFILDMLNYSRNSRAEIKKEKISFEEILTDIKENLQNMGGSERKVDVRISVKNGVLFQSDKGRLSILFSNIISNAIRYQNPKAENPFVDVSVAVSKEEAFVSIKDNGIGIDKQMHEKVFDMFYRVSDKSVGSGLGLYIVKETISKLNGTIEMESELGKGTTFNIHIPNN